MKLIVFLIIIYLIYRGWKYWEQKILSHDRQSSAAPRLQVDDVMVKDPYCEVYFPKRDGVSIKLDGRQLIFCSEECRDKYLAARTNR